AATIGVDEDTSYGAVMPPLYLSANYSFHGFNDKREYDYSRSGNPTRDLLGRALAELEGGAGGVITASGMAAVDLAFSRVPRGGLIVAPKDCYGGSYRLLEARRSRGDFDVAYIDASDLSELDAALTRKPDLVHLETPTNPLMRIVDLEAICLKAKAVDALVSVDNTFLSPARQTPIAFGADMVIHSTTKYINGHSDIIGGAVVSATEGLHEDLSWWANCVGVTGSPFDAYQTLRGLRTLFARMDRQEATAGEIATFLAKSDHVERVYYAGLPSHPGHEVAKRQQKGFGAMLSFDLKGGTPAVKTFIDNLGLFSFAESLGGVESLIAHPATMTHSAMAPEARARAGIGDGLLRLSIGLETPDDLIAALQTALMAVERGAAD
ncbi:MAG: cystathionine gamma-synthase, partial [Pseudomonadota bacterium]